MENNHTPEIRFSGFTEEWEQQKVGDFYFFKNGLNKEKEFFGSGTPIVNFTDVFHNRGLLSKDLKGKVQLTHKEINNFQVQQGDIFFTRTSETIEEIGYPSVMIDNPINTVFSGFVLRGRAVENDPLVLDYKRYVFFTNTFREEMKKKSSMTTRALTSGTAIKEMLFSYPKSKVEQEKIGKLFKQIDETIVLLQQELTTLKQTKQGFLQKMFPKEGESVPEVRFPGFSGMWEERKLIDNIEKVLDFRGKSPVKFGMKWGNSGYLVLSALNVKDGYIDKQVEAKYGDQTLFERWMGKERLKKGDIVFTTEAPLGKVAQVPDDNGYILNQRAVAFKTSKEKADNDFFAQLLRSPLFQTKLKAKASGGTAKGIGMKEFSKMNAPIPVSVDEQTKIGSFFKQIDDIIVLQQRELDALKETKNAFFQKMFV